MTEIVPPEPLAVKGDHRSSRDRVAAVAGRRLLDADEEEPAGDRGRRRAGDLLSAGVLRAVRRAVSAGGDGSREYFHPPQRSTGFTPTAASACVPSCARCAWSTSAASSTRRTDRASCRCGSSCAATHTAVRLIPSNVHLFGVDPPGRILLFGTDSFGRDVFSRLLYGAQISLTVGVVGIMISFTLGLLLGGIAGYFGGFVDTAIMRLTELLLSIPSLYLIIALRAVFPMDLPSRQVYLGIVAILAFIGWAGLARVIRGLVLSMRKSDYVTAAEALGFGRLRVIARHVLPNTMSYVIVAATLSIPGYILGEVVLSFLGVGVQEPSASWGNMLNQARSIRALTTFPWLLLVPGTASSSR